LTLASGLHSPAGTFTTTRHIEAFTDLVKLIFCIQYAVHLVNTLIFAAASPLENRDVANCLLAARSGVVCCQLFFHQTLQPLGFVGIDNLINFFRMSASEILDLKYWISISVGSKRCPNPHFRQRQHSFVTFQNQSSPNFEHLTHSVNQIPL
jgi:hypothetical protein